jgi:hydroxymethylpyrimidine/phosphomethylpyrimidine kinase
MSARVQGRRTALESAAQTPASTSSEGLSCRDSLAAAISAQFTPSPVAVEAVHQSIDLVTQASLIDHNRSNVHAFEWEFLLVLAK